MKKIAFYDKNIINKFSSYLNNNELNPLRLCSKYFSIIIGYNYFSNIIFSAEFININNKHKFRYFVHKYKLIIGIENINSLEQLLFFNTFNVHYIDFNCFHINKNLYTEYFLSNGLKTLIFDHSFNRPLNKLPPTLENLTFGIKFNQSLQENIYPTTLKKLKLGNDFNKEFNGKLFPLLIELEFGNRFNQDINEMLPITLKLLNLGYYFNKPINTFSSTSEHLTLSSFFNHPINILPPNLKYLKLGDSFKQIITNDMLSLSLETLIFGAGFTIECYKFDILLLNNLHTLIFGNYFTANIPEFPISLRVLNLGDCFDRPVILPPMLESFTIGNNFNHPLIVPPTLKILSIGNLFNHPIEIPENLKSLSMGISFFQQIIIPKTLKKLKLGILYEVNSKLKKEYLYDETYSTLITVRLVIKWFVCHGKASAYSKDVKYVGDLVIGNNNYKNKLIYRDTGTYLSVTYPNMFSDVVFYKDISDGNILFRDNRHIVKKKLI